MNASRAMAMWESVRVLRQAFGEQQAIVRHVHTLAAGAVCSPSDTPTAFAVDLDPAPGPLLTLRRNLFSTLFQSTYHVLEVAPERRILYGSINYLFRIWVTSADNLLDQEDKVTLPIRMPGQSRVMRQVVAIMAADRILEHMLNTAVLEGHITREESAVLSKGSLQVLLPSAAQEATEEGGITNRPRPEYVLDTIHRLKTGMLFQLPFMGPERIEHDVDRSKMKVLKNALMAFGLGCQILDDIRDMARDHRERRHNYILSCLQWSADPYTRTLDKRQPEVEERLHTEVPHVVLPAARLAMARLCEGLTALSREGLNIRNTAINTMAGVLFDSLDLADIKYAL
ncbi:MAG: hypothetical protein WCO42_04400 [bacterium]